MKALKNYADRLFLILGHVRDEFILKDNSRIQLDHYLYWYLTCELGYKAVAFLDARGLYYFDAHSLDHLRSRKEKKTHRPAKGLDKLKHAPMGLTMKSPPSKSPSTPRGRLRYTYDGDINEIAQFMTAHLSDPGRHLAFVVYDGALFEKLPPASDIGIQIQGLLRNSIFSLPGACRNIWIWVDGDDEASVARRFMRLGLDFVFSLEPGKRAASGSARVVRVETAGRDEVFRAMALHGLEKGCVPAFNDFDSLSPSVAGAMRHRGESIKNLVQYMGEEEAFFDHLRQVYGLQSGMPAAFDQLRSMTGLTRVKETVTRLVRGIEKKTPEFESDQPLTPDRFRRIKAGTLPAIPHLALLGNPGTGKTTVARLIGKILKEEGLLESGHMVEATREKLVAGYMGQSAGKTRALVEKALGGVLFIDEAYELVNDDRDSFGTEALAELVKAMSDFQGRFMVIFAGYPDETRAMLNTNPGCARRISYIDLPDYSAQELAEIMMQHLNNSPLHPEADLKEKVTLFCTNLLDQRELFGANHFGNAGVVINQIETALQNARANSSPTLSTSHFEMPKLFEARRQQEDDINTLVGLGNIKGFLVNFEKQARLEKEKTVPGHYIFQGSPGTGKTIAARQMAKQFFRMGLLNSAKLNAHTASQLIGQYQGETENRTNRILNQSLDGVLFIDEAHQLAPGPNRSSYGESALNTILPFMEDNRSRLCLIFAGYPDKITALFDHDSGLRGRFDRILDFPDYSAEELAQIFFLKTSGIGAVYDFSLLKAEMLIPVFERIRTIEGNNFANARFVRSFIEKLKGAAVADADLDAHTVCITPAHIKKVETEWT